MDKQNFLRGNEKMKRKLAMILCTLLVATSGSLPVYAAEQGQPAVEAVAAGQVQQTAVYGEETLDAAGAALTEKTVTVKKNATAKEINEALELNKSGQYDLTVEIPAGTYKLTEVLWVYPNTTIKADKSARLIKQKNYGAIIEAVLKNDKGGYEGNHDITIDGGIWDSEPCMTGPKGTESFRFIHCSNITVKNATLCNVPSGSHLIVLAGVKNATITNCTFSGYGKNPTSGYKTARSPKEAVQLDTVHSVVEVPTEQKEKVKWDDLPCDTVTIKDCTFTKFSRGIGSHTAVKGELHNNVTIEHNTFKDLSDSAIRMYNYKNSVVKDNTITNALEGILIYTYIEGKEDGREHYFTRRDKKTKALPKDYNITVTNNKISKIKDTKKVWGDGIRVLGASSRKVIGVKISNNTISTVSRYGIFATQASKLQISGNKISSPSKEGILLENGCNASSITGKNEINNSKASGISIYKSNKVNIYGNTVNSPKKIGICLLDSNDCVVGKSATQRNTITSPGEEGISVSRDGKKGKGCSGTKVQYNRISGAVKDGIFVCKSVKTTVKGNTVSSKQDAINVNTSSKYAKIMDNTISTAGGTGIWLASGSKGSTVSGNTIKKFATKKADANGIYIYQSGGTSAKRNTVVSENTITGTGKGSKKNGIKVSEAAYTTLEKNDISNVGGCGIYVYKSKKNTLKTNTVNNTKKNGIYITTNCGNAKVTGNTVKKAGDVSIMLFGAPNSSVTSNKVTGSRKYRGIWISQSNKTTVKSNTVKGAKKKEAVFVSGSTGCKVSNNKTK